MSKKTWYMGIVHFLLITVVIGVSKSACGRGASVRIYVTAIIQNIIR
ncbi:MAG: hypothetical protein LBC70_03785 [Chitinispirillales bacterium]|nr:hypothetical protein [Chitinispirillales bacterium]